MQLGTNDPLGSLCQVTGKKSRAEHAAEVVQRLSQAQLKKQGFVRDGKGLVQ